MGGAEGRHVEHCSVPERRKEGRERYSDIEAFNKLWGEYLIVSGRGTRPVRDDKKMADLHNKMAGLTWQIIRAQATCSYQIDYKFELLREIMEDRWCDGRREALVESIRNDVCWLEDHLRMVLEQVAQRIVLKNRCKCSPTLYGSSSQSAIEKLILRDRGLSMQIGYARSSTIDQEAGYQAQIKTLNAAGCDKILLRRFHR